MMNFSCQVNSIEYFELVDHSGKMGLCNLIFIVGVALLVVQTSQGEK